MSRWVRRAAERRVRIASRRRARRSPRAAGGLGTCSFRRSGRLRGCSAFRHPHQGTSVALLPGTRLAHSSDPSGLSSYGLTKSLGEGDISVASEVVTSFFFMRPSIKKTPDTAPRLTGLPPQGRTYNTSASRQCFLVKPAAKQSSRRSAPLLPLFGG